MAIKIGTSNVGVVYVDNRRARHLYLDKKLVFSDKVNLTLTMDAGVASVTITSTRIDGLKETNTYTESKTITYACDSTLAITATAKTGYTLSEYATALAMTNNATLAITTSVIMVFTNVNLMYGGTEYGNTKGDKIGTFQYSTDNSTWSGNISNEAWDMNTKFAVGSYLYFRNVTAAPGFTLASVTYNGQTIIPTGGVYKVQIANGSYSVDINYNSATHGSSVSFAQAISITTNSLSRTNWNVSFNLNINVEKCSAGTVIGTVPYQYRPATARTYTTTWLHSTYNGQVSTNTATITINPNGTITSNLESTGTGSASGGAKWGSYTSSWYTTMTISGSWSVI